MDRWCDDDATDPIPQVGDAVLRLRNSGDTYSRSFHSFSEKPADITDGRGFLKGSSCHLARVYRHTRAGRPLEGRIIPPSDRGQNRPTHAPTKAAVEERQLSIASPESYCRLRVASHPFS